MIFPMLSDTPSDLLREHIQFKLAQQKAAKDAEKDSTSFSEID